MITLRPGGTVILIALLVPMALLLLMIALAAFEDYLFPPRQPPPLENTLPEQSEPD
ncbi:hypothetical protein [Streptomyces phaeochromogenes]|uniref:hypothetical protein n=1 Tax=Streptomyces phaeochromogenes TaxID=1923 RepID=UPI0038698C91|nr:hypothetical protein OG478_00370 [Streptomyces phaeochromogenes]WSW11583.1 hypothetical protein OG277_00180 [Streptomyces phaeochromogenes]